MTTFPVDILMAEYRTAAGRLKRLERAWLWTRLVIWPGTVIGIVAIATSHAFAVSALLTAAGLAIAFAHIELLRRADTAAANARAALAKHTGIDGERLQRLIDGADFIGGQS